MKHQLKLWVVIYLVILSASAVMAQPPDTSSVPISPGNPGNISLPAIPKTKKERSYHPDSNHSPHLAVLRSLMVPGWGQIYNNQWWKVPIIYGGLGAFGYYLVWNNNNYIEYLALSTYRDHATSPPTTSKYYTLYQQYKNALVPDQAIYDQKDYCRRNRDLCILGFAGCWVVNAIDAYIDAKFMHSFTMDNSLSMQIIPEVMNNTLFAQNLSGSYIPAIKVTFTF